MLSRSAQIALRDIAYHIALITEFVAELDFESFERDLRTSYAVTRCLEIISEASRRLPDDLKAQHPEITWRKMAAAGNLYRHNYEAVAAEHVWQAIQLALPPLKVVVDAELARLT